MVSFKNLLALASLAGTALALPAPAPAQLTPRGEYPRALLQRLQRRRAAGEALLANKKRDQQPQPVVPYDDLTATSDKPGGLNYTGYKNPTPANAPGDNPHYVAFSAFDWHSLNLVVHQEFIELDLFNYIVAKFTPEEFHAYGLTDDDVSLIQFYGQQEIGHALVVSNLLGEAAPYECTYQYDFNDLGEAFLFSERVTRFGESGVYGFLPSLDNRALAQILLQSITTEARQEFTQRQWLGLQPSPVWFETGITQSYAWTLLSPWIKECPSHNTPVGFSIFPKLNITNNPDSIAAGRAAGGPAITHNVTALSHPGDIIKFAWNGEGEVQGPYRQKTEILASDKTPRFAAWVSQYNVTYSELENVTEANGGWTGATRLPGGYIYPANGTQSIINETVFVSLVNEKVPLSPLNLSAINNHTIAGPQIFYAG